MSDGESVENCRSSDERNKKITKQPWKIELPNGEIFATGNILETYTIITTDPNELVQSLNDRMPEVVES